MKTVNVCDFFSSPIGLGHVTRDIAIVQKLKGISINFVTGSGAAEILRKLNYDTKFKSLDLRIAPASPGKANRLKSCLNGNITTIYVNLEEANLILNQTFLSSKSAAEALAVNCNTRVIVTDGPKSVTLIADDKLISAKPPTVKVARITGAGDVFMASHIQAEMEGHKHLDAIKFALNQTANYISSSDKL